MHAAQEIKQTNFFKELHLLLRSYRTPFIIFGLLIPCLLVVMSGAIPFIPLPPYAVIRNAYILVPVCILCFGHTFGPILLSPSVMLVKF
jgi:hypothetical protein